MCESGWIHSLPLIFDILLPSSSDTGRVSSGAECHGQEVGDRGTAGVRSTVSWTQVAQSRRDQRGIIRVQNTFSPGSIQVPAKSFPRICGGSVNIVYIFLQRYVFSIKAISEIRNIALATKCSCLTHTR